MAIIINGTDEPLTTTVKKNAELPMPETCIQYGIDYKFEKGNLKANLLPYAYIVLEY